MNAPLFPAAASLALALLTAPAQAQVGLADAHTMLPADDDGTESMDFGDVDGDGDVDVVFGNAPTQNRLLLNDGVGVFTDATSGLPVDTDMTCAVLLADLDGDLHLDLLVGNGYGGGIQNRLYFNDGNGVFVDATATNMPADFAGTEDIAVADVDADGDLDVFLANDNEALGQQNFLYLNDGAGVLTDVTAAQMPVAFAKSETIAVGDVDGDADCDVVFVNDGAQNALHLNDGFGVFSEASGNLPVDADGSESVVMEDFDGDLDLDLVIGNGGFGGQQNRFYRNDGTGLFTDDPTALPVDSGSTEGLAAGDVDGDLDLDVYAVNFVTADRLYINDGAGVFADTTQSLPSAFPSSVEPKLADVDGDGDLDAIVTCFDFENRLLLNDGLGAFQEPSANLPSALLATTAVVLADVDGDDDLDAVFGDQGLANRIYLNDGAGSFPSEQILGFLSIRSLLAIDVENDGDPDLVFGQTGANALVLNDGAGNFSVAPGALPDPAAPTGALVSGDVDGNGDLDIVVGNFGQDELLLNTAGTFALGSLPVDADETRALALADVDGDTALDLLAGNGFNAGQANRLYLGDGAGGFTDASSGLPSDMDETGALAVGDVDLDGELDFVAGNGATRGALNRVYLGDGLGAFAEAIGALPGLSEETGVLALADFDEDGDPDLLVGNGVATPTPNRALWNDGAGVFAESAGSFPARAHLTVAIAVDDLDGDGDLDALIAESQAQSRVMTNLARQVSWRGEPRINKALEFEMHGDRGDAWFLAYSIFPPPAPLPIPFVGTLFLDVVSIEVVAAGALDVNGRATVTLPIPDNPLAVGLQLPWQGVLANAPFVSLTNLEYTRFTDL